MTFSSEIVEGTPPEPREREPKQGHICCGVCCDTRRATMIVNVIHAVTTLMFLLIAITAAAEVNATLKENDEPSSSVARNTVISSIFMSIVAWLFTLCSFWGAWQYKFYPVLANAIFIVVVTFTSLGLQQRAANHYKDAEHNAYDNFGFWNWFGGLLFMTLFVYPHVMYCFEVRSGIMSVDTYQIREKHSCCCA